MISFKTEMSKEVSKDVNFDPVIAIMVLDGVCVLSNVIVFVLIANLLGFHIWISFKGISTFEYIMKQ